MSFSPAVELLLGVLIALPMIHGYVHLAPRFSLWLWHLMTRHTPPETGQAWAYYDEKGKLGIAYVTKMYVAGSRPAMEVQIIGGHCPIQGAIVSVVFWLDEWEDHVRKRGYALVVQR